MRPNKRRRGTAAGCVGAAPSVDTGVPAGTTDAETALMRAVETALDHAINTSVLLGTRSGGRGWLLRRLERSGLQPVAN